MKKGAAMRIGWPDLKKLINAYVFKKKSYINHVLPHLEADHRFGSNWDEVFSDCLFGWEHRYAYTAKHLAMLLDEIGFKEARVMKAGVSAHGIALDFRRDPATTFLEAVKK
jgi:hypothetical protein